ncbi:TPA: cobalt-factor II C(20)-methyltransferase [Salmonella enterica]|uniref:Cobalt-factor II C(20)-methyltransferase n=1 Tax=Salmonella enterica TaxID=28901 RepID=A0A748S076_SALER|nr:cobalt-factor II C(20)-methyltransferase [Salmonella enterica]HAF3781689.1 cobalt-factor II C(20)-methyltransferase [Salmonella enterica]HAF5259399.1 cobalt-factor II C(20)-methyltransferase [Salmonella enterica]HAK2251344.1 cobalt-factor II C(20)-methyltransferase [Salmonella enterica]HAK2380784.1 cobalt-factor II C(20)-methyltransferase [Salmonella enterica]HAK2418157.1 cobalt-factor II C(20)-methyltransferase [Salmonella enterica]
MNGKLYALSTGPGAPDLITVRAARILGSLDILYAPAGRKGGDAMLFSTWIFLLQRIGCPEWLEIVPGVTSFAAIAARAKMPLAIERQSLAVISCTAPEAEIAQALQQHDSLVLMKVYGRFARIKALLAQAGLLECALMMSEATLLGEQCWRHLHEVNDDRALPYFSTILVNKQWEYAE